MTDIISSTPIAIRSLGSLRLQLPKLGVGRAVEAVSRAIMQAFEMVYVAPYTVMQGKLLAAVDANLEGRDPNW